MEYAKVGGCVCPCVCYAMLFSFVPDHSTCQATLKETGDCQQPKEEEGLGETDTKEEEPQDWMDFPEKEVAEQLTRFDAVSVNH